MTSVLVPASSIAAPVPPSVGRLCPLRPPVPPSVGRWVRCARRSLRPWAGGSAAPAAHVRPPAASVYAPMETDGGDHQMAARPAHRSCSLRTEETVTRPGHRSNAAGTMLEPGSNPARTTHEHRSKPARTLPEPRWNDARTTRMAPEQRERSVCMRMWIA